MTQTTKILVSVIIRTLNEERYLPELMCAIASQVSNVFDFEIVIVDSGSSDGTLRIAEANGARVTFIEKKDFSFGRSLNLGCAFARGEFLVFVSGHCIPTNEHWLHKLVSPLKAGACHYTYGRQEARDTTKFSEKQLFAKYFPKTSRIPQEGFFCNNANAAISKKVWNAYQFDVELTGCEDMDLAKRLCSDEKKIGYVADASVFHIHDETWDQVQLRYEREAVALQKIMPELHITKFDVLIFFLTGVVKDFRAAISEQSFWKNFVPIIRFRKAQYFGAYIGNNKTRSVSQNVKQRYFYPRITDMAIKDIYDD